MQYHQCIKKHMCNYANPQIILIKNGHYSCSEPKGRGRKDHDSL